MSKRLALTFIFSIFFATCAEAASFDCNNARLPDEKTICAVRTLNDKDVTVALLYSIDRRFMGMGSRGALMDEQARWLQRRHACGTDERCLQDIYDQRIKDLRGFIDERVVTKGPF